MAMLQGSILKVVNLGDSGLVVVRDGEIIFQTPCQNHGFNFPYQIGSPDYMEDPNGPDEADIFEVFVQKGDAVVVASDGLFDNIFADEMAQICWNRLARGDLSPEMAEDIALTLATTAQTYSGNPLKKTPFAKEAREANAFGPLSMPIGGKPDDTAVIVALVE
eukprot:gene27425-33805_t